MRFVRSTLTNAAKAPTRGAKYPARAALASLLLGATAIGFAPILVRLSELGPVAATAFYRLLFSLPALWLWYALAYHRTTETIVTSGSGIAGFALAGFAFAADLAVWHWSLRFTSVANATLFPNFAPVFVTLAGFLLFGERFSKLFLAGMAIAMGAAIILLGESLNLGTRHLLGDALALATAVFYACYIVIIGQLRRRHGTVKIMAWSGLVTCAALLSLAVLSGESLWATSVSGWAALGLFSHALGQSLIAYALAHLPAAFSSIALLAQPAVAALLAWQLLGEALGMQQAIGAAVILVGIALARSGSLAGDARV